MVVGASNYASQEPKREATAQGATRRIRLFIWGLIAIAYSIGAINIGGMWGVLLTMAGLLGAFLLGMWTVGSRGLASSPKPVMPSQAASHAQAGLAESSSVSSLPVTSQPQGEGLRWSELLQRWNEEGLLLPLPGCHYAPPSVVGDLPLVLLGMARGLQEVERLRVEPIRNIEEAERYLRVLASIPAGAQPEVLCVLPTGAIGRLGRARPNLPEWHDALSGAKLRWLGERRVIRLEGDLYYFPLVAEFQIHPTPSSSTQIPSHKRRLGLYLGVDTSGNPAFLSWPWHVVVVGRSGSGKTNTLRHLLAEAVLAARWMRTSLIAVSVTAKEDGMAGVLRVSAGGKVRWVPLSMDQAERLALAINPARPSRRIRLLVIDEAQELIAKSQNLSQAVQKGFALGRANRFVVVLATSNARSDYLPAVVTQHAAWLIHSTDGNEAALLLRRAAVEWSGGMPTEPGEALFVDRSRNVLRVWVPSNSFDEVVRCGT